MFDGGSAPYGAVTAICSRCHGPVEITVETNGDGALIDWVEPCPACAPRRPAATIPPRRTLIGRTRRDPGIQAAIELARQMLTGGDHRVVEVARLVGLSHDHVRRVRKELDADGTRMCGCGRPWTHGGRCTWRREQENKP